MFFNTIKFNKNLLKEGGKEEGRWNGVNESSSWETRYGILNKAMVDNFDNQWDYAEKLNE